MKKMHYLLFTVSLFGALLAGCGSSGSSSTSTDKTPPGVVHVTDNITTPTTWTSSNIYVIDNSIAITAVLTIQPGTIVKFTAGTAISVNEGGTIVADGQSAATPITFTSIKDDVNGGDTNDDASASAPAAGDWRYINVTQSGSVFNYCRILYGGGNAPYIGAFAVNNNSTATVTNCVFAYNKGGTLTDTRAAAMNAGYAAAGTMITGNTFFGNDMPLVVSGLYDVDNSNTFHYIVSAGTATVLNKYNGIFFNGPYNLTGNTTWSNTEVPYVILSPLSVNAGSSLTLADNVVVKFDTDERIEVSGTLTADGTNGIIFTSLKDDSVGGDTNGDGATTTPAPGDWRYVNVTTDGSLFDRCSFFYAGSAKPYSGTLCVRNQSTATITNSTFAHNAGGTPADNRAAALNLGGAGAATVVTGNTFYDNDMPLVINGLVSIDNTNHFHVVTGGTTTVTNTYNGIFMDGVFSQVTGSVTWFNTEVPYVVYGTVLGIGSSDAANTGTLTLADNVILKFESSRIDEYLYGTLNQGTGNYFTSFRDDSLLGDTNADSTATSPVKGDWAGVNRCKPLCSYANWDNILYATNP